MTDPVLLDVFTEALADLGQRPAPFGADTVKTLWVDPHLSAQMLAYHLNPDAPQASRPLPVIEATVAWLAERLDLGPGRHLCDFGCGPGLYTQRLAAGTGATVTGLDFSPRSLAHARAQADAAGLAIAYHEADYLAFDAAQRFDAITLIYGDLCPLSPEKRRRLYDVWRRHLKPGGRVAFDVFTRVRFETLRPGAFAARRLMDGFWSPGDYLGLQETFLYDAESLCLERYTIVEADGRVWRVYNWLQHFTVETLTAELADAGFVVEDVYGDLAGAPLTPESHDLGVIARLAGATP